MPPNELFVEHGLSWKRLGKQILCLRGPFCSLQSLSLQSIFDKARVMDEEKRVARVQLFGSVRRRPLFVTMLSSLQRWFTVELKWKLLMCCRSERHSQTCCLLSLMLIYIVISRCAIVYSFSLLQIRASTLDVSPPTLGCSWKSLIWALPFINQNRLSKDDRWDLESITCETLLPCSRLCGPALKFGHHH